MRCPLRSFRHRQLTQLICREFNLSRTNMWVVKVSFYTDMRSFSGKMSPCVDCYRIQADPGWWPLRMRALCYHDVVTQAFNILGVSFAIKNEDKRVESSKIHSIKYEFPIYTTHGNCSFTLLRKNIWNGCYSR